MRPFVLLLVVLLPAVAPAAQTPAADSALASEVVRRYPFEHDFELLGRILATTASQVPHVAPPPMAMAPHHVAKIRSDATRAMLADLRPDLLREVLAYLDSGVGERVRDHVMEQMHPDRIEAYAAAAFAAPPETLGDSSLAARMLRAGNDAEMEVQLLARVYEKLRKSTALRDRLARRGIAASTFFDGLEAEPAGSPGPSTDPAQLVFTRYLISSLDPADVDRQLTFLESPARAYFDEMATPVTLTVLSDVMASWFEAFLIAALDTPPPPPPGTVIELDLDDVPRPSIIDPLPDGDGTTPDGPFEVVEQQPELIGGLDGLAGRLVYPESARRASIEGTVLIQFVVDTDGTPRHLQVLRSPDAALSEAAVEAVRASRFTPGTQEGRAVRVRFTLPVRFALQ